MVTFIEVRIMWAVSGNDLKMTEGDFGLQLPITISGTTLTASDEILFTLKDRLNGETILTKTFDNISQNTINLTITEAETDDLPVGSYVYSLDWYQDGAFMCNIIPCAVFKVVEKA